MNRNILDRSASPFVKYIGLRERVADVYGYKLTLQKKAQHSVATYFFHSKSVPVGLLC